MVSSYYQDKWITIYHGDCREILPQLDIKVDLVLTDPPYNGDIKYGDGTNDSRDWNEYCNWLLERIKLLENVCNGPVIVFISHKGAIKLSALYEPYWIGAWYQFAPCGNPVGKVGATLIMPYWEPYLIYGNLKTIRASLPDYVQSIPNKEHFNHPCPKPISIMSKIIVSGDWRTVLDSFMGTGTVLMAAKLLQLQAIGIEIEERYCEIAANRCRQSVMELGMSNTIIPEKATIKREKMF